MNNMRGNERLIQLSRLQATGGGVLSLANATSLERPRNLLAPKGWLLSGGPCCSSCLVDFRSVFYCRMAKRQRW